MIKLTQKSKRVDVYTAVLILACQHFKIRPTQLYVRFEIKTTLPQLQLKEDMIDIAQSHKVFRIVQIEEETPQTNIAIAGNFVKDFYKIVVRPSSENLKEFTLKSCSDITISGVLEQLSLCRNLHTLRIPLTNNLESYRELFEKLNLENLIVLKIGQDTTAGLDHPCTSEFLKGLKRLVKLQKLSIAYSCMGKQQQLVQGVKPLGYLQEIHLDNQLNFTAQQLRQLYTNNLFLCKITFREIAYLPNLQPQARKVFGLFSSRRVNYDRFLNVLDKLNKWECKDAVRREHLLNLCQYMRMIQL